MSNQAKTHRATMTLASRANKFFLEMSGQLKSMTHDQFCSMMHSTSKDTEFKASLSSDGALFLWETA